MLLIRVTILFAFLNRTLAILLPPADPAINLAAGSSVPSLTSLNASFDATCDSVPYGFNLDKTSCEEAIERLALHTSRRDRNLVYINRDKHISGERIVLPWRVLSCTSYTSPPPIAR